MWLFFFNQIRSKIDDKVRRPECWALTWSSESYVRIFIVYSKQPVCSYLCHVFMYVFISIMVCHCGGTLKWATQERVCNSKNVTDRPAFKARSRCNGRTAWRWWNMNGVPCLLYCHYQYIRACSMFRIFGVHLKNYQKMKKRS